MKPLLAGILFVLIAAPAWAEDLNIDQTPDVFAPALGTAGTAPCIVAGGVVVGVTGFGIAGGTGITSEDCENRNYAALLANIGEKAAARAYLCRTNPEILKVFEAIGVDCFAPQPIAKEQAKSAEKLAAYERQIQAQKLLARFKEMDAAKKF